MRSYQVAYRRLLRYWDDDQPATALMRLRAFLLKYPDAKFVWLRLGLLLTELARYDEARDALMREIEIHDFESREIRRLYVWMGDTYRCGGDGAGARNWYRSAMEVAPEDCEGYCEMGSLMLRGGRLTEALYYLREGTKCKRASAETWCRLGMAHRAREEFFEAVKCYRRALELDAEDQIAQRALKDVRAVIARLEWDVPRGLSSEEANCRRNVEWNECQPSHNVVIAREYLAEFPENERVWLMVAKELKRVHRYSEAREAIDTAMQLRENRGEPPWLWALTGMGDVFRKRGDFEESHRWYGRAIISGPDDAGPWIFRGALLAVWGRFEESKLCHRRATQCAEGCIEEAWYNLGLILRAQERFDEAANCLRQALAIDPDYEIARQALRDVVAARAWQLQGIRTVG
jgi:tetratricopeptide (TPR) repeat protein